MNSTAPKTIRYSVIAPVYNEIEGLQEFYRVLHDVMEGLGEAWEVLLVDDGSTDGTRDLILTLADQDARVVPLIFTRNFGHQIAVTAGMDHARGEAVIIIDADLQDPPQVIPELIEKWKEGYEVVYAVRREREGETWFKRTSASAFYRLINRITDINIPLDTGDFRLLDREVLQVLNGMRERERFLRGMSAWVGFNQIGIPYDRKSRYAGKSKYPFKKMLKLALNAVTGFSTLPLQLAEYTGFAVLAGWLVYAIVWIVFAALKKPFLTGQALTIFIILLLGGLILTFMGIIGEYISRIYDEAKGRPLYILRNTPKTYKSKEKK
ncbi:MAG TPA: glycosyltransferase [Anaerolineaceae bacterium]|uniref:Glycosyl transferase family protein n=1 Tax=Anaerolinea thermophila TaxID=167964 RepID=A0A101FY38_9CHLR|nr:MAG: Glycosyl transferase family protein [Anaerolinea thermophila]HAF62525.1 glycosyltransferase [Anaerolineaceae bacterium]